MNKGLLCELRAESDRIEEDAVYTAKGHWNAAAFWNAVHVMLGLPAAILAALTGASATGQAAASVPGGTSVTVILAAIVTGLTVALTFLNPKQVADAHRSAGDAFKALGNEARIFRNVELLGDSPGDNFVVRLHELNNRRSELISQSPQVPRWSFLFARRGVSQGEATYRVDGARIG